jgi:hypothetical protein
VVWVWEGQGAVEAYLGFFHLALAELPPLLPERRQLVPWEGQVQVYQVIGLCQGMASWPPLAQRQSTATTTITITSCHWHWVAMALLVVLLQVLVQARGHQLPYPCPCQCKGKCTVFAVTA